MNQPISLGDLLRRRLNQPKPVEPDPKIRFLDIIRLARCLDLDGGTLLEAKEWLEAYAELTGRPKHGEWTIYEAGAALREFVSYHTEKGD